MRKYGASGTLQDRRVVFRARGKLDISARPPVPPAATPSRRSREVTFMPQHEIQGDNHLDAGHHMLATISTSAITVR